MSITDSSFVWKTNHKPGNQAEIIDSGAILSSCQKYRYALWRIWKPDQPKVLFIMLNPSTADAHEDDPTLRRCMGFAHSWGFGGVYTGNLFAYRTTDPKILKQIDDPIGADNDKHLISMINKSALTIAAWGQNHGIPDRIRRIVPTLHCLALNKGGTPGHPLYLRKDLTPRLLCFS
jgi:hypothetical protein